MSRPSAGALVVVALSLAATSGAALLMLPVIGIYASTTAITIAGLGTYVLLLIAACRPAAGAITGGLLTLLATTLALLASGTGPAPLLMMLGWTWLVRCALLHRSILGCLADGALLAVGVAAALWSLGAGAGLALSLWCFYLIQVLLPWLPGRRSRRPRQPDAEAAFLAARRRAEAALRRLYSRPVT
ncbi:MAG: hypothetical protein AAGI67_10295 [Pseudomonadota bacterium]